jgi:hypothetical protein
MSAFMVALRGKADIAFCGAHVRFDPKRTWMRNTDCVAEK